MRDGDPRDEAAQQAPPEGAAPVAPPAVDPNALGQVAPAASATPDPAVGFDPNATPSHDEPANLHAALAGEGGNIIPSRSEQYGLRLKQLAEDLPLGLNLIGVQPDEPSVIPRAFINSAYESELASQGRSKISAAEANKRYPGIPVPFTEPVYPEIADLRYSSAQHRRNLQELIDRGPEIGPASNLLVGAAGMLDPVNILSTLGIGKVFQAAGAAAGVGSVLGQNFLGNLAGQLPAYFQNKSANLDTSITEEAKQAAYGAIGGTALHFGLSALFKRITGPLREQLKSVPEPVQEKILREQIAQHESGLNLDSGAIDQTQQIRASGEIQTGAGVNSYQYGQLTHPSDAAYYTATAAQDGSPVILSPELGTNGIHATDNAIVANNHAGPPESQFSGKIQEMAIGSDANLINLDEPLPESLMREAISELKKSGVDQVELDHLREMSGREVFQALQEIHLEPGQPTPAEAMQARARAEGFDGYHYVEHVAGQPSDNRAYLFDQAKITPGETMNTNKDAVPSRVLEEQAYRERQAQLPESQIDHNPDIAKEVEAQINAKPTPESVDATAKQQEAEARKILERPEAPPELAEHVAAVDEEFKDAKRTLGWAQVLADCVMRGIT